MSLIPIIAGASRRRGGAADPLTDGLLAWWDLATNGNDSTANGYDLTATGTPSYQASGGPGDKPFVRMNGTDNGLHQTSAALNDFSGDVTMAAWVRAIGYSPFSEPHLGWFRDLSNRAFGWRFRDFENDFQAARWTTAGTLSFVDRDATALNVWYLQLFGWRKSAQQVWTSTNLAAERTNNVGADIGQGDSWVIFGRNDLDRYAQWDFAPAGIWNRDLTSAERTQLYNSGDGISASDIGL